MGSWSKPARRPATQPAAQPAAQPAPQPAPSDLSSSFEQPVCAFFFVFEGRGLLHSSASCGATVFSSLFKTGGRASVPQTFSDSLAGGFPPERESGFACMCTFCAETGSSQNE